MTTLYINEWWENLDYSRATIFLLVFCLVIVLTVSAIIGWVDGRKRRAIRRRRREYAAATSAPHALSPRVVKAWLRAWKIPR